MYSLIIDSATKILYIALVKDNNLLEDIYITGSNDHAKNIVSKVDELLKKYGIESKDLSEVVCGYGPGSYTGVRIGVTIAKTIAYALKIKLYAKSSLSLLKHPDFPTICLFNARSGRSYFAVYEGKKVIVKDSVLENENVIGYIKAHPDYLLHGDTYQLGLESSEYDIIGNLADFDQNDEVDAFKLKPVYLKDLGKWLSIV